MKAYQYIIIVKDRATKAMDNMKRAAGLTDSRLNKLRNTANKVSAGFRGFGRMFSGLGPAMLAAFSIGSVMKLNGAIVQTTAEFEKYRAVLDNTFQSAQMGQASFQFLTDFASNTPFQLNELTGSFVKMVNRGIVPTKREMTSLGDMAASQGKSFDQYTEAILDAGTGEFERLKEFGVVASAAGDKVSFSFKGQTKTVAKTQEAIQDYLISLGEMDGVKGSMKSISLTLGGMLSNLRDKFGVFAYQAGQKLKPLYEYFIDKIGKAIDWISTIDFSGVISGVVNHFEYLKARLLSLKEPFLFVKDRVVDIIYGFKVLAASPIGEFIAGLIIAVGALNVVMSDNPVGAIVTGVALLIGLLHRAWTKVEWFRGSIMALSEGFKHVANTIKDHVISRFKEILGGLGKLGQAVLSLVKGRFKDSVKLATEGLHMLGGEDSKRKLVEKLGQTGKVAAGAYYQGAIEAAANGRKKLSKDIEPALDYESMRNAYLSKNAGGSGSGNPASPGGAIAGVTGGGHKQTHITINVGKLNEQINIHTTNLKEGGEKVAAQMEELLLRILNSANQMQTS